MQFTYIALLSLVAVAFASPVALPERLDDLVTRQTPSVSADKASMSDKDGNVLSFDSTAVYLDATAKGQ